MKLIRRAAAAIRRVAPTPEASAVVELGLVAVCAYGFWLAWEPLGFIAGAGGAWLVLVAGGEE